MKLVKPLALATSATLRPVASNGAFNDWAELAFSTSEPRTAGSTSGRIPRRASVAGRVASEQRVGASWAELRTRGVSLFRVPTMFYVEKGPLRVEVLLSRNQLGSPGEDVGAVAQLLDDLVGELELWRRAAR